MQYLKFKTTIQKYWLIYFVTIIIAFVMKFFCQTKDSNALIWILAPTSRWVSILSGIRFEYIMHEGYINHFYHFLIAPSCSGIRFMLLTFLMLVFSFLYQIKTRWKGYLWFIFSALFAYMSTIFVNGIRITAAIYIPIHLQDLRLMNGWLNPDRLHTIIGTLIYFLSLCIIYSLASVILSKPRMLAVPSFWYLLVVLAFPFVKRIIYNEWSGFGQYALLIITVYSGVIILLRLLRKPFILSKSSRGYFSPTRHAADAPR